MGSLFTNPAMLSACAIQAKGDPDVPDGVHIRVAPSAALGFPVSPFLVWRVSAEISERTKALEKPEGGAQLVPPGRGQRVAAALIDGSGKGRIAILERGRNRTISRSSKAPWIVASPAIDRVRVTGGSGELVFYSVNEDGALKGMLGGRPMAHLALPLDRDLPWYVGGCKRDGGLDRAKRAAPSRISVLDRPDGPFQALHPEDEGRRILVQAKEIDRQLEEMLSDAGQPPWMAVLSDHQAENAVDPEQSIEFALQSLLLLQSADPGIARYLGLADILPLTTSALPVYAISGVFAIDPKRNFGWSRLTQAVGEGHQLESQLIDTFCREIPGLDVLIAKHRGNGFVVRALTCVAAAPPPPDLPSLVSAQQGQANWLDIGLPSQTYRTAFSFVEDDLPNLLAMARQEAGGWVSCGQIVQTDGPTLATRRLPMLLGRNDFDVPISSDSSVPAPGKVRYRFHISDLFGRFGSPVELDVVPPSRPAPPTPAPQIILRKSDPDHQDPSPRSPGKLRVLIPFPALENLSLGAQAIGRIEVQVDDAGQSEAGSPAGGEATFSFELPALEPTKQRSVSVRARFVDTDGTASDWSQDTVRVADARRPKPVPTGPGLIWTSLPGPAEHVELKLCWPAAPGALFRAYIADAQGLEIGGTLRAEVGVNGVTQQRNGDLNGEARRRVFRLLTDSPITAQSDGFAILEDVLPRALQSVQFVRIVPVTEDGVEADFDACGLVPVAVPRDYRPPPPLLSATVSDDGVKATLRVRAPGLNQAQMRVVEPSLFVKPVAPDTRTPYVRLRRVSGQVDDPIYARIIKADVSLAYDGEAKTFVVTVEDGSTTALRPFVRYTYWAEVAAPAERRLPPGVQEVPTVGGVTSTQPGQSQDMPGLFSAPSSPVSIVASPATAPSPLAETHIAVLGTQQAGGIVLTITLSGLPVAHPKAIAPFRIMMWREWQGEASSLIVEAPIDAPQKVWSETHSGPRVPVTISVVLVDPLGRRSAVTQKSWT